MYIYTYIYTLEVTEIYNSSLIQLGFPIKISNKLSNVFLSFNLIDSRRCFSITYLQI